MTSFEQVFKPDFKILVKSSRKYFFRVSRARTERSIIGLNLIKNIKFSEKPTTEFHEETENASLLKVTIT